MEVLIYIFIIKISVLKNWLVETPYIIILWTITALV